MNRNLPFVLTLFLFFQFSVFAQITPEKQIDVNDKFISYMGRIGSSDTAKQLYWSGSSIKVRVKNTKTVAALLDNDKGDNYFYIIIDGVNPRKLKITGGKKWYNLLSDLDANEHTIELFKITNSGEDFISFYGFGFDNDVKILKPSKKSKRKLEFFGDSVTCGHGVDIPIDSTDSGASKFFNNYKAYAATTARYFNAQYHCTAKSGIGVTISWYNQIMPEIYDRINPNDKNSQWNFSNYTPEIVVVNLFQNDSWLVYQQEHEQFKIRFGTVKPSEAFIINAYADFLKTIRNKYPKAKIICCLGAMGATSKGSKWPGYIESAVASLHDKKITTLFFPYKNTSGHPKVSEQQDMADILIAYIKEKYWH